MEKVSAYKKTMSQMLQAITRYKLIEKGDKIAVGVSGGKDSLTLLKLLSNYQKYSGVDFELYGISIDLFGKGSNYEKVENFCKEIGVPYYVVRSNIYEIIFEERKEKNPCSLCSKMRRGALNTKAIELGCNKIALGHHSDDLMETFFLSMFYEGRLSTFAPMSYMDRTKITLIRPLLFCEEKNIVAIAKNLELPVFNNCCPANHETQREYAKNLLKSIQKDVPACKKMILTALVHPERYNLFDKYPIFDYKTNTKTTYLKNTNVEDIDKIKDIEDIEKVVNISDNIDEEK